MEKLNAYQRYLKVQENAPKVSPVGTATGKSKKVTQALVEQYVTPVETVAEVPAETVAEITEEATAYVPADTESVLKKKNR